MSDEVKRFKMPWHDDPMAWPKELRAPGTVIVLAADYDAKAAECERLREALRELLAYEPEYCACGYDGCDLPKIAWSEARAALEGKP